MGVGLSGETRHALNACRLGAIVVAALLWSMPNALVAAEIGYCGDQVCNRQFEGENCSNCSQDCECICGDDVCTGTEPSSETCYSCYEDCYSSCICGDSQCTYPAEGSGYGGGQECENSGFENCETCVIDCGTCSYLACWFDDEKTCNEPTGECVQCDGSHPCLDEDFNCVSGHCIWVG